MRSGTHAGGERDQAPRDNGGRPALAVEDRRQLPGARRGETPRTTRFASLMPTVLAIDPVRDGRKNLRPDRRLRKLPRFPVRLCGQAAQPRDLATAARRQPMRTGQAGEPSALLRGERRRPEARAPPLLRDDRRHLIYLTRAPLAIGLPAHQLAAPLTVPRAPDHAGDGLGTELADASVAPCARGAGRLELAVPDDAHRQRLTAPDDARSPTFTARDAHVPGFSQMTLRSASARPML